MTDRPLNIDPRWSIWFPEYIGFGTGYNKIDLVKIMGRQIRIRFVKIVINWITNQRNDHEKSFWAFKKTLFRKKIVNFGVVFDKIGLIFDENHRIDRCWWRTLESKCVGNTVWLLVTVLSQLLTIWVTYIHILHQPETLTFTRLKFCHQHPTSTLSPTSGHQL